VTAILDTAALAPYLAKHLPGDWATLAAEQFVGGQSNPTFRLDAGAESYVLRKKPPGVLLPSAHAIDREYRVLRALGGSKVPVPRALHYCEDASLIGTPFYIMDYVAGRVFRDPRLPGLAEAERAAIYDAMNEVAAQLHALDVGAAGLADFGRPDHYLTRQIERWMKQYRASETRTLPAMERLIEWLPRHMPATSAVALVHGDLRLENMVFDAREPRLLAVLDWELATLGDPLADLAYNCLPWRLPARAFGGMRDEILCAGIPNESAYTGAYFRRTGSAHLADWRFYLAFALFRLAAILQGVLRRALDGNGASTDAVERGLLGEVCAEAALPLLEPAPEAVLHRS
jgi:aminoglycoside phosphotransferase (APT) family kinase protein